MHSNIYYLSVLQSLHRECLGLNSQLILTVSSHTVGRLLKKEGSYIMDNLQSYIKPELLVLVPVLYVIGAIAKNTERISDKYIPALLGVTGVLLSTLYVVASEGVSLMSVFTAITQGVLVAGASVYVNQVLVQTKK